jgi:hypothetical protein
LVELSLRKPKFTSRITMAALQAAFLNAGSGELFIHHALGHHPVTRANKAVHTVGRSPIERLYRTEILNFEVSDARHNFSQLFEQVIRRNGAAEEVQVLAEFRLRLSWKTGDQEARCRRITSSMRRTLKLTL